MAFSIDRALTVSIALALGLGSAACGSAQSYDLLFLYTGNNGVAITCNGSEKTGTTYDFAKFRSCFGFDCGGFGGTECQDIKTRMANTCAQTFFSCYDAQGDCTSDGMFGAMWSNGARSVPTNGEYGGELIPSTQKTPCIIWSEHGFDATSYDFLHPR